MRLLDFFGAGFKHGYTAFQVAQMLADLLQQWCDAVDSLRHGPPRILPGETRLVGSARQGCTGAGKGIRVQPGRQKFN